MTLNEEVAKQNIEDIGVNLPGVVVESSYSVEDDELIITKGKAGVKIDTEKLLNEIKERLNDVNLKEEIIEIPVLNKEPESIDIDKIHEEIYTEAKDAYYTKNPFAVYPYPLQHFIIPVIFVLVLLCASLNELNLLITIEDFMSI